MKFEDYSNGVMTMKGKKQAGAGEEVRLYYY